VDQDPDLGNLGVVIVHYRREADVARLVDDLVRREGIATDHIVVVDNGSGQGRLAEELERRMVSPAVVSLANVGYPGAMNIGVRHLPGDAESLLLLTHEVVLHDGCVRRLQEALRTDPEAGLVGPLLINGEGQVWSAGGLLTGIRRMPGHRLQGEAVEGVPPVPTECAWLDGAVLMTTRPVWEELGGMDERFFLYAEDVDLGLRVTDSGRRVLLVPQARAEQTPSAQIDPFLWTRNPFLLFHTHGMRLPWSLWLASVLVGIVRDCLTLRFRQELVLRRLAALHAGVRNKGGRPPVRVA
jgi:N-acetylglucosaminyl-diphospho-decaprenol L-rhamnosyltransferase